MNENKILIKQFASSRDRLRSIAYRILGSTGDAEDAVQEAWLRLARADGAGLENPAAWLTTVVARICLDMLRARKSRREELISAETEDIPATDNVERDQEIGDNIGIAMLVVLETLSPAERVAFVLHDMFDFPFPDIARIVGRTSAATRQLASRGRGRIQGASATPNADRERQRKLVDAFLLASQQEDFAALLALLDPNVVLHADAAAIEMSVARESAGAPTLKPEIRGGRP
jgi:RNA polymerase sigma-70 factor, ECF subfamily